MNPVSKKAGRLKKWSVLLALALAITTMCGCRTLSFYAQAAKGQYQLFAHQQPIRKLLADSRTPPPLQSKLELLRRLLAFAKSDLNLPVDGHYRNYVDVHRRFVVWDVEAAPEFSMEPKSWWYPLVGRLEYRGYFAERGANGYAAWLERKGFDVYVGGVEAYSTLGWFKDPALNTFIFDSEPDLAELIFHELGHQQLFARGDEEFNEAFATTVGQEGARRWLRARGDAAAYANYQAELGRTRQFVQLITRTRRRLEALYGDERTESGKVKAAKTKSSLPVERLRLEKQRIYEDLQQEYSQLKAQWGGKGDYDDWFSRRVNNAKLNSVAAYYDFVPGFEHLLEENGGDFPRFFQAAARLAKKPKQERHRWLTILGRVGQGSQK
jgi:predicted aminopeptidase